MDKIKYKRLHKVISLLIKSIILILSFFYIWQKINEADKWILFPTLFFSSNLILLFFVIAFMLINWSLEAMKWKLLIATIEPISFLSSLRSIFAGVTVSIFTPNRIGEFAGRVFFLEKADKVQATMRSLIGSVAQFVITVCAGLIALFAYFKMELNAIDPTKSVPVFYCYITEVLLILGLVLLWMIYRFRNIFSVRIQTYIQAFFEIERKEIFIIVVLSAIRYSVFSFQYYLVLQVFQINVDFKIAIMLIAITFLVTSVIPTFALTEIAVRGASAVYFFSAVGADPAVIVAASFTIWFINLAMPAIIGSFFIWKLKFFKD